MIKGIVAATAVSVAMMATGAFAEIELKIATDSGDRDSPSGMAIANWASAIEEGSNGEITVKVFYQNELGG
jgi:TRAP-type C4-dicarboxylate transport system substrate-binding protein